ncbi:MAG: hypothetical protein V4585_11435 [Bacteroidota bacterium]
MKKTVFLLFVVMTSQQLLAQTKLMMTKEEKMQAIDMISAIFEKPLPSKIPILDVISEKKIPTNFTQSELNEKIMLFTKSLYFKKSVFRDNEVDIEADFFHLPNSDVIQGKFNWLKGVTSDGSSIKVVAKNSNNSFSTVDFLNEILEITPTTGKPLIKIEGTFSLNYPTVFSQIFFLKSEIGKEKNIDGGTIKLLLMENDIAQFQISNHQDELTYYALNDKGEVLSLEISRSEIPKVFYEAIGDDGNISENKKKEIVDKFELIPEKEPTICYIKARGSIAKLIVVSSKNIISKQIPIMAHKMPDFQNGESVNGSNERYDLRLTPLFDKINDLDLTKLPLKISRQNEMFGFNNHMIHLSMPNSPNAAFAKVEFKDVDVTKAGNKVEFEPQGAFYDENLQAFSFRIEPTSGDIPVDCDLIKGSISIQYPTEIITQKLPVNVKSDAFEMINPNAVKFFEIDDDPTGESLPKTFKAFATNGLALKKVEGNFTAGSANGRRYTDFTFWGKVAFVQISKVTKWINAEIPFSLKPSPALIQKKE